MSATHRKLSSASTASTSSLRQVPDFEPDDNWKVATQRTIEDSLLFMIKEAKEELQRKLDAEPNISPEQHAAYIEDYKRTENGIKKLAQEEFDHALHKERMERRWAAGQAIPNQISEALRTEQQTILDSIQKSTSGGDSNADNITTNNAASLSSPASASKPPHPKARRPTRRYSRQDSSDESEDDFHDESDHLPNHSERGKDSPLYRSRYESSLQPPPPADRNGTRNHQIWKPSISPEEDALADSPHVTGRQVGRRASMTSIKSTGSTNFRPPSGHNSIPEFSEEVEHGVSNSEREKAQTRLAEQQWSTLNRARDKEKTSQRSTPIDGRRSSVNDIRTPSPMTSGPAPPLPPLATKPIYRPPSQASLLSASRPPAESYPSPASANRYSGSNYGSEGPQRFQPPQIKPSDSLDSTGSGSFEGPLPGHHYSYYGSSSYEEQRSYPTPSSLTRASFPRRENEHYGPPYRDQEYARPDSGSFRPPSGPPYQDYNEYRSLPSSGPEGPIPSPYDYPIAARRGWAIPNPSYSGPYPPNHYDRGIPFPDASRRGSTSESYRSRGSLEQGDEAWRFWKAERSSHHEGGNQSDDDLGDLKEDEHEEIGEREEDKRRSEEAQKREAKQREEEERRREEERKREAEIRQREEEARKKEEEMQRREEEARRREEEEDALRKKEEEIKQKEADARKKEEDIKRKEEQAKKKEAEVKKKEAAAKKKEAEVKRKEEDAQRREAEAARKAEEYQRREQEVKAKEEELLKREEELKRKEREIEERRREEEKRRQQEEAEKRKEQQEEEEKRRRKEQEDREREELERLADIEEQKHLWQQVKDAKEEQRRLEEFKRQQSDAAWNNMEKQDEKQRKEAEFERRQQDIHRQRQDSLGSAGLPTSTFSSASSASYNTSRTTATSATSPSSGTPPSWTTWANQPSASARPSVQSTSTPTSKSPPNMSHASTPSAKSRTGGEPPPSSQEEWQRRQEELARKQQEKFRLEQEKLERVRLQKAGTMLTKDDVIRLFDAHNRMWASLRAQANSELRWDSFPWPVIRKPSGPDDITYAAVDAYIFSPYYPETDSTKSDKDRVKEHIRKWHPDRFDTKWLPNVVKKDQSLVKEGAGQVVRYLNDLLAKKNSPGLFS